MTYWRQLVRRVADLGDHVVVMAPSISISNRLPGEPHPVEPEASQALVTAFPWGSRISGLGILAHYRAMVGILAGPAGRRPRCIGVRRSRCEGSTRQPLVRLGVPLRVAAITSPGRGGGGVSAALSTRIRG